MDLDGDGAKDIITGSYSGDTYFFRNEGKGKYAKAQIIKAKNGESLRCGATSTAGAGDWNGDGKIDLIIQGSGKMMFAPGTGKLAFGDPVPIVIDGKPLQLSDGVAHAVDWNQDGKLDIVTGNASGRISFYPLVGVENGVPQFGEAVTLVEELPKDESNYFSLFEYADQEKQLLKNGRSGNRAKVTVTDWDDDGKLDLLVGDLLMCKRPDRTFTEAQLERKKQLEKESMEAQRLWMDSLQKLQRQVLEGLGLKSAGQMTEDQRDTYTLNFQKAINEDPEHRRLTELQSKLREELDGYSNNPQRFGFVWVYLQK